MQQGDDLLHFRLCQPAVFDKLHPSVLIQHNDG